MKRFTFRAAAASAALTALLLQATAAVAQSAQQPPAQSPAQLPATATGKAGAAAGKASPRPKARVDSTRAEAVATLAAAERLARMGEKQRDPLLLLAAARVMIDVGAQPASFGTAPAAGDAGGKPAAPPDPQALLARAKQLAEGRSDLVAMIDETMRASTRGAIGGPKRGGTVVRTSAFDVLTIAYEGGQEAAIAISGDGESDLDVEVYDPAGNLVCRADGPSDQEICRWVPRATGVFRIRVLNNGVANAYRVMTN